MIWSLALLFLFSSCSSAPGQPQATEGEEVEEIVEEREIVEFRGLVGEIISIEDQVLQIQPDEALGTIGANATQQEPVGVLVTEDTAISDESWAALLPFGSLAVGDRLSVTIGADGETAISVTLLDRE